MAKEYVCGYCGKKYSSITDRTKCEQMCAHKAEQARKDNRLTKLKKELESIRAKIRTSELALKALKQTEAEALEEISKLEWDKSKSSADEPSITATCYINGKQVDVENAEELISFIERMFGN